MDCAVPEKNPYPPHGRSLEFLGGEAGGGGGGGSSKPKFKKRSMKLNWNFLGGRGYKTKTFRGGVWIFSRNCTICTTGPREENNFY